MNAVDTNVLVYAFDVLYTEDLDAGTNYEGVRIVDPFS